MKSIKKIFAPVCRCSITLYIWLSCQDLTAGLFWFNNLLLTAEDAHVEGFQWLTFQIGNALSLLTKAAVHTHNRWTPHYRLWWYSGSAVARSAFSTRLREQLDHWGVLLGWPALMETFTSKAVLWLFLLFVQDWVHCLCHGAFLVNTYEQLLTCYWTKTAASFYTHVTTYPSSDFFFFYLHLLLKKCHILGFILGELWSLFNKNIVFGEKSPVTLLIQESAIKQLDLNNKFLMCIKTNRSSIWCNIHWTPVQNHTAFWKM